LPNILPEFNIAEHFALYAPWRSWFQTFADDSCTNTFASLNKKFKFGIADCIRVQEHLYQVVNCTAVVDVSASHFMYSDLWFAKDLLQESEKGEQELMDAYGITEMLKSPPGEPAYFDIHSVFQAVEITM
jgi:hypothetical protein